MRNYFYNSKDKNNYNIYSFIQLDDFGYTITQNEHILNNIYTNILTNFSNK